VLVPSAQARGQQEEGVNVVAFSFRREWIPSRSLLACSVIFTKRKQRWLRWEGLSVL